MRGPLASELLRDVLIKTDKQNTGGLLKIKAHVQCLLRQTRSTSDWVATRGLTSAQEL